MKYECEGATSVQLQTNVSPAGVHVPPCKQTCRPHAVPSQSPRPAPRNTSPSSGTLMSKSWPLMMTWGEHMADEGETLLADYITHVTAFGRHMLLFGTHMTSPLECTRERRRDWMPELLPAARPCSLGLLLRKGFRKG